MERTLPAFPGGISGIETIQVGDDKKDSKASKKAKKKSLKSKKSKPLTTRKILKKQSRATIELGGSSESIWNERSVFFNS